MKTPTLKIEDLRQLAFINRQPSLWSHSCPGVKLIPSDRDDNVIQVSPLFIEPLNCDHDGDTLAVYCIHDKNALIELYNNAYLKNVLFYDSNTNMLSTIRHEALYAAFSLTQYSEKDFEKIDKKEIYKIDRLENLPENIDLFNNCLGDGIELGGKYYSYGVCLLNKWIGVTGDKILINKTITKSNTQEISKLIFYKICSGDSEKFYSKISELERKLFFFISVTDYCPSLNFEEMVNIISDENKELFKKLPQNNAQLGFAINEGLVDRCIDEFPRESELYKLFRSGSRFSKTQLARSCISIGYTADDKNIVDPNPITSNLLSGLSEEQFFRSSPGTRKGLADKAKFTPVSGYIERTIVMAMSPIEIAEDDCGVDNGIKFKLESKKHAESIVGKYFMCPDENINSWNLIDSLEKTVQLIGKEIILRTPMLCKTKDFKICKKCFGAKKVRSNYIGIIAAQCTTERLTQLIMRVFHTSGAAELNTNKDFVKFVKNNLIDIKLKDEKIYLIFNSDKIPDAVDKIAGYDSFFVTETGCTIIFDQYNKIVRNNDTVSVLNKVKEILRKDKKIIQTPTQYYLELINLMLSVGIIYSSYIEMILAHMFVTDIANRKFWRYNSADPIVMKLSDKTMAAFISPLLGLLYQPNKKSIAVVDTEEIENILENTSDIELDKLSIHEKLFLELM